MISTQPPSGADPFLDDRLDRPLASDRWLVPAVVDVVEDRLFWNGERVRPARQQAGLLEGFLRLRDAPAEAIRDYARRWGILGICKHGLPASHNPPPIPFPRSGALTWCAPLGRREGKPWEPLEAWRRYSGQMRAALNIAASLHDGHVGRPEDWRPLYYKVNDRPVPWWKRSVPVDRAVLSGDVVGDWLNMAHVRLEYHWHGGKPGIRVATRGLFGALVVQLALAISRTDGLAVCSGCGLSYVPLRRPRENQRRYCAECRRRQVPVRDAATDYRRRRLEAHSLSITPSTMKNPEPPKAKRTSEGKSKKRSTRSTGKAKRKRK